MRTSAVACFLGICGALVGGWLIGRWALGLTLIALSAAGIAWGLLRDDGVVAPQVQQLFAGRTPAEVLERARRAP